MLTSWSESSTWNALGSGVSANGVEALTAPSFSIGGPGQAIVPAGSYDFDVKADVQAWADGATNEGWAGLWFSGGTNGWGFAAREWSTQSERPLLSVTWEPVPEPATMTIMATALAVAARRRRKR